MTPRTIELPGAGLTLAADTYGEPGGQPVLLLHGGGQTRHAWGGAGERFAVDGYYAVTVDLRGHSDSEWSPDGLYSIEYFAADVRAVRRHFDKPPVIVGASLGGLSALVAIGEDDHQADLAAALVLVDIAPRVEESGRDHVRDFMRSGMQGFESVDAAADAVAEYLPHRPRPTDTSGLAKNLRRRGDRWYWHWDPRWIENTEGVDGQSGLVRYERLKSAAAALTVPTLLVRGKMSDIVSDESVAELQQLVPHVEIADVGGAGHMVAGDKNDQFNQATADFIKRVV